MKKKPVIIVSVAAAVSVAVWYGFFSGSSSNAPVRITEKDTVVAHTGTIRTVIQWVGTATAASTQTLQFNSNGKIVKWNVAPGDKVKKGQVLAEVDSRDVTNDIRSQELALSNANISYEKLFTAVKDSQVAQSEASVAQLERAIASAPTEIANLEMERDAKITDQKSAISQTQRSIALANEKIATLESDASYAEANASNTVNRSSTDLSYILTTAPVNAGTQLTDSRAFVQAMENSILDFAHPNNLPAGFSAKDSARLATAVNAYEVFRGMVPKYSDRLSSADFSSTGGLVAFLDEREALAHAWTAAADALLQALNASVPAGSNFSQSSIDSLTNTVTSYRSKFAASTSDAASVRKQIASLDDPSLVRQNADNTLANKRTSILEQRSSIMSLNATLASQKAALEKLESDYAIKLQQKRDSLASSEESLKTARLTLADLLDGPTAEEIKSAKNQIEQARISLDKAKKRKEDYQIIASFDGIVTSSNGKVGEISSNSNSSSTSATTITVEVPGLYEISVLVDQLDVVKISEGQSAEIKFDAYPEETFTGTVAEVDPTPVTSQGVVSYKSKILFKTSELRLYNNMTAVVSIVTSVRTDAVMVPTLAISTASGSSVKTVRIFENGKIRPKEVKTGLTEGNETEILSGVTVGEKVVSTKFVVNGSSRSTNPFSTLFGGSRTRGTSSGGGSPNGNSSNSTRSPGMGPPPGM